ncbi:efflux RND transporter periplasmic adaptor subunit [Stenotrophomonas sp. YIM B06876]|uniref:efflux RND transporter periplasmic adaptor subunit n=1 Tax=Stenotrophomonas sp. YIM B06876 TaxID=3060211 RepID=UPI002739D08B|nr:efflux RND transporter periplasmic adaptor subunit [Stenotrophomonas sp. YIM B06876]
MTSRSVPLPGALLPVALATVLAACSASPAAVPAAVPAVEGQQIRFAADSRQLKVLRSEAAVAAAAGQLQLPARMAWDDTRTSYLRAPLSGQVAQLAAVPGQAVKAGQVLAWIASPEYGQIQAEGARGAAELRQATQELARVRELHAAGVASGRELDEAQTALAASRAEQARSQALMRGFGNGQHIDQRLPLRAPIDGVLVERNLSPGMSVGADSEKPLVVVSDPAHLWLLVDVPEHLAGRIHAGQPVQVTDATGATVQTRLEHVADYVDPETRVIQARAQIDNSARRFKAGQYLHAQLEWSMGEGVSVPADSVLLIDDQRVVFVEEAAGRFRRRDVQAEDIGNGRAWISHGVQPGEKVVVDGGLLLQQLLAQAPSPAAAGHGNTQAAR